VPDAVDATGPSPDPAPHPIPPEIESSGPAQGDPLAGLAIAGSLRWLDPAAVPFRLLGIELRPAPARARLAREGDANPVTAGEGSDLGDGWKLLAIRPDGLALLSPRGNPARIPATPGNARPSPDARP